MENYNDLVLQNEIGNIQMIRPIKGGESIIDTYPLDVIEKLGKYQFIYDYSANSSTSSYNMNNWVNFSKGDVVEVVRFQLGSAIINNPNYKEYAPVKYNTTDSNAPKTGFFSGINFGELVKGLNGGNRKELEIPKEYLQKVDDSTSVTIPTGVNFGANPKPQPVSVIKTIPFFPLTQTILEENASFVLAKDFEYVSGYGSSYCSPDGICTADMSPKYSTLKAGTKVTGRLFKFEKTIKSSKEIVAPQQLLAVKGYGDKGSINIPIEYLTRDVQNNTNNNSGEVVPVANDNKKILMIVGAFLIGYVLFNKGKVNK
jgi:hypothetical protein